MTSVLDVHLTDYEDAARLAAQDEGMDRRRVEDLIDLGLALFAVGKAAVERWHAEIESGREAFDADQARGYEAMYRTIGRAFDSIRTSAERLEARGVRLETLERFRAAHEELNGLLGFSVDGLLAAEDDIKHGRTRSIGEVRDELRRKALGSR